MPNDRQKMKHVKIKASMSKSCQKNNTSCQNKEIPMQIGMRKQDEGFVGFCGVEGPAFFYRSAFDDSLKNSLQEQRRTGAASERAAGQKEKG